MILDNWDSPAPIAHRGSRLLWPENTMEAFQGAIDLGIAYLETDLHTTADGVIVCIHDDTVDRTTDGTGPVSGFTYQELTTLDAGYRHQSGGHPFRGRGLSVPRLDEVVTAFPHARMIVDLKEDGMEAALADLIQRHDLTGRIIVGSFSDLRLTEFNRIAGGTIPVSTGQTTSASWVLASKVGRGVSGPASALQLPIQMRGVPVVTSRLVEVAHGRGVAVHVWTVNDPSEMHALLDLGVDGIVTDRPDLLKEVLVSRGDWKDG